MTSEFVSKIPADELDNCKSWLLPEVSAKKIIPSVKEKSPREKAEAERASRNKKSQSADPQESVEVIETIEDESVQPLTAEQLQSISESAEKEGYESGYQKGFDEAKQKGYEEGINAAKTEVLEKTERLQHLTDALLIPLEHEQKVLEQQILDMVCQLTRVVVHKELLIDSSNIVSLVSQALALLPNSNNELTLYLNDQDIELVKEAVKDADKHAQYKVDNSLLPGGCRLETSETSIDYTVEHRLQQVLDDFLHKRYVNQDEKVDTTTANINDTAIDDLKLDDKEIDDTDTLDQLKKKEPYKTEPQKKELHKNQKSPDSEHTKDTLEINSLDEDIPEGQSENSETDTVSEEGDTKPSTLEVENLLDKSSVTQSLSDKKDKD